MLRMHLQPSTKSICVVNGYLNWQSTNIIDRFYLSCIIATSTKQILLYYRTFSVYTNIPCVSPKYTSLAATFAKAKKEGQDLFDIRICHILGYTSTPNALLLKLMHSLLLFFSAILTQCAWGHRRAGMLISFQTIFEHIIWYSSYFTAVKIIVR